MKRLIGLFALAGLMFSLCACCAEIDVSPSYTAHCTMYIGRKGSAQGSAISPGELTASANLTETYAVILRSNIVLEKVIAETHTTLTPDELREMIRVESVDDAMVLKIRVTAGDSQLALELAEALCKTAPEVIGTVVEGSVCRIVDRPTVEKNAPWDRS